jgi:hypothetical protein
LRSAVALTVCASTFAPAGAAAQLPPQAGPSGWPAVEIGARVGWDNSQRQEVVGAVVRVPILRNGSVELLPNADVTFLRGVKEYQLNAEAVYVLTEGDGGIYAGGGVGLRDAVSRSDPTARETITTFSIVVGIKFSGLERINPLLEFRRVFASELVVDPQMISIGVTFELW